MAAGLPLFGLTANPFADRVLDPLERAADADLFTPVDGFRALGDLGDFLRQHVDQPGPTYVLVLGPDGSGRSSVANLVAGSWKIASAGERRLLLPRAPLGETRSARRLLGEWLAHLRGELRRAGVILPPAVEEGLKDLFAGGCDGLSFLPDVRYLLAAVDVSAREQGHHLVALLDDLDAVDLGPALLGAFADTRALVVVVAGDYPSQLDPLLGEGGLAAFPAERTRVVRLGHLDEEDVVELVRSRWDHAVRHDNADVLAPPVPFDLGALGPALARGPGGPRTLRRILQILQRLLEMRQEQLGGGGPVSDEQVRFGAEELAAKVRILDELGAPI
jgi:hypothetical protein